MENQDRSLIISDQPSPLERREEGRIVVVREKDDADLRDAFSQFEAQLYPVHAVGKLDIEEGDVGVHPRRVLEARRTVLITPDDFDFVMLGEDGDKHLPVERFVFDDDYPDVLHVSQDRLEETIT